MELSPGTGSMVEPGHSWAVQVSSQNCKVTKLGGKGVPDRGYRQKAPLGETASKEHNQFPSKEQGSFLLLKKHGPVIPDFIWKNAEGCTGKKGLERGNGEREEPWAVRERVEQLRILWTKP